MSSTIFSGNSRYANDFSQYIDRAVAIASLPLTLLQQDKVGLNDRSSALSALDTKFDSLSTALTSFDTAVSGTGTFAVTSSDITVARASSGSSALPGDYRVEVSDLGSYASSLSRSTGTRVSDPSETSISTAASFSLAVTRDGTTTRYQITPESNTLNDLAAAINEQTDAGVRATIVNVGSSSTPDYRLSLQSTKLGEATIELLPGTDMVESTGAGVWQSKAGLSTVTDPAAQNLSAAGVFNLDVDGTDFQFSNVTSLNDLRDRINAAGAGVTASVVDADAGAGFDYRLQLTGTEGASVALTESLQSATAGGSSAAYTINGSEEILSDTRSVTLAPGLTAELLKEGSSTVTVARSTAGVSTAIMSFVTAYNAASDAIDAHRGEAGGALAGDALLYTLRQSLREMVNYSTGTDGISSLTSLGLSFSDSGKLNFDSGEFAEVTEGRMDDLLSFLGSSDSDGFLKVASDAMKSVLDPYNGLLTGAITSTQSQISADDDAIEAKQEQIDNLRTSLEAQMAAADALIASLEQQVEYMTNLFESMRVNSENM